MCEQNINININKSRERERERSNTMIFIWSDKFRPTSTPLSSEFEDSTTFAFKPKSKQIQFQVDFQMLLKPYTRRT